MNIFTTVCSGFHRFKFCVFGCCLWLIFFFPSTLPAQKTTEIKLDTGWEFRKYGDTTGWMPATVPGCVHTDLMANNVIPDPFYSDNEKLVQWVENEDWEYRTVFAIGRKLSRSESIEINFDGLDTYADVYLNDSLILQANNMFTKWSVDIKSILHTGKNKLYIRFYSAVKRGKELMLQYPVKLPGDERVFTRKAQYQYGWDWGPRLVTCGIWQDVNMIFKQDDDWQPSRVDVFPVYVSKDSVLLAVKYNEGYYKSARYELKICNTSSGELLYHKKIHLGFSDPVLPDIVDYIKIDNPPLWWCNGMGSPDLFHFSVSVQSKGKKVYSTDRTVGFKTLELVQDTTGGGSSFYFKLNGSPVFSKGANYIPSTSFPSSATKETYRKLLLEAKQMNMNMIRIWGGGIYADDYIYELCDSLGILVWQDFMFAGGMYPLFENYSVDVESYQQVSRLRDHVSLALLCGNNEISEGWYNWGWQRQYNYSPDDSAGIWRNYKSIFDTIIPSVIRQIENTRKYNHWLHFPGDQGIYGSDISMNYHPSSPTFGWGHPESLTHGDCHYWGVWWGHEPFEIYNKKIPRFMSEYGFQGMPSFHSFKQFIPANELAGTASDILNNPSVKNHQKHPVGYETIQEYMERDYKTPEIFEDYIYVSQLLQARGMQTAIEAHRRNMPYCMGTLFWQLNDCWPVTSWSVIDYYGNRKAAYYTVKEKYEDVIISIVVENDSLAVYVVNDRPGILKGRLVVKSFYASGENLSLDFKDFNSPSYSSRIRFKKPLNEIIAGYDTTRLFLYVYVLSNDTLTCDNYFYFTEPKNLQLPMPEISIVIYAEDHKVAVASNQLVKNVYLYTDSGELKLSDNFFDLAPGIQKVVTYEGDLPGGITNPVKYKCLNTIYGN